MIKICPICNKEFETYDKPHRQGSGKKKGFKRITCSKPCSVIFCRVARFVHGRKNNLNYKKKQEVEK